MVLPDTSVWIEFSRRGSRGFSDLIIAVAAAHAGYALWTFDTDFKRIVGAFGELELYGGL